MDGIGISGNVSLDMNVQNVVGVHRYDELRDKPEINGVEVSGSKSLDDYGIASKTDVDSKTGAITKTLTEDYKTWDDTQNVIYDNYVGIAQFNDAISDAQQLIAQTYATKAEVDALVKSLADRVTALEKASS